MAEPQLSLALPEPGTELELVHGAIADEPVHVAVIAAPPAPSYAVGSLSDQRDAPRARASGAGPISARERARSRSAS